MTRLLAILALVAVVPLLAGCPATVSPVPAVEYKTTVVDTSCQTFRLILVPTAEAATLSPRLSAEILAHDRAYSKKCLAPAAQ